MRKNHLTLAWSNTGSGSSESRDCPQTMFYRFASSRLDIGGIHSANQFRKLFLGKNPLYRLGMFPRSLSYWELFILIMKQGHYSTDEATDFIESILGQSICYSKKKCLQKIRVNGEEFLLEMEEKKYFTLRERPSKWSDEKRYYLEFATN